MPPITINLGQVAAIFVGMLPPTNTNLLWRDISSSPHVFRAYNNVTGVWEPFCGGGGGGCANAVIIQFQVQEGISNYFVNTPTNFALRFIRIGQSILDPDLNSADFTFNPPFLTFNFDIFEDSKADLVGICQQE